MSKEFNSKDPEQNRYLTEGCCPNRHGPLERVDEFTAACRPCKMSWKSKRVAVIWPRDVKESA